MFLNEVTVNSSTKSYRFHLRMEKPGRTNTGPVVVTGRVTERGNDFVRVRQAAGYREARDILIPLHAILYIKEIRRNQTFGE